MIFFLANDWLCRKIHKSGQYYNTRQQLCHYCNKQNLYCSLSLPSIPPLSLSASPSSVDGIVKLVIVTGLTAVSVHESPSSGMRDMH